MRAVILAGGLGTRLHPETLYKPKAMVDVNGYPALYWVLRKIASRVHEVVMCVDYLGRQIEDFFGPRYFGLDIKYVYDRESGGGAGKALLGAADLLYGESFFLINGDTYLDAGLDCFIAQDIKWHRELDDYLCTVAVKKIPSNVSLKRNGSVLEILSKPTDNYNYSGWAILNPACLYRHESIISGRLEDFLTHLATYHNVGSYVLSASEDFYDWGTPGGLERFRQFIKEGRQK